MYAWLKLLISAIGCLLMFQAAVAGGSNQSNYQYRILELDTDWYETMEAACSSIGGWLYEGTLYLACTRGTRCRTSDDYSDRYRFWCRSDVCPDGEYWNAQTQSCVPERCTFPQFRIEDTQHCTEFFVSPNTPLEDPEEKPLPRICEGNPINIRSGAKQQTEADYQSPSGLGFTRSYSSKGLQSHSAGLGWSHNFGHRLEPEYLTRIYRQPSLSGASPLYNSQGAACVSGWQEIKGQSAIPSANEVVATYINGRCELHHEGRVVGVLPVLTHSDGISAPMNLSTPVPTGMWAERADGSRAYFSKTTSGYAADRDVPFRLVETSNGYELIKPSAEIEEYDSEGRLTRIVTPSTEQNLTYDESGRLSSVSDIHNRSLGFQYDAQDRLEKVLLPGGLETSYTYDANNRLVQVQRADDSVRLYSYTTSNSHRLAGITDELGNAFASWTYDSKGRAISSEHAGGAERVDITYNENGTVTATDALGATRVYEFGLVDGDRKLLSVSGDACFSCGAQAAEYTYDSNGYIASKTDFNGNLTEYSRDELGLELTRTEAVGTSNQRTISTTWDTALRLPLTVTEPGRTTTYSYDGVGRRLSQSVSDTATGEVRTTLYSYSPTGLLETVDGPRTDIVDVADYAYDSSGNLVSVTNALGHVTEITSHDAHGNPLTIIDPDGLETLLTYDARQRLKSRSVDGAVTHFEYDAAGQLVKLTQANGALIAYEYDDAQRLTAIEDKIGNRIVYTLDAMGNRIKEEVLDSAGTLRRSQIQVFNELSLLKEVHGANSQLTEYDYDANGNRTAMTEAGLYSTLSQFDALNRLMKVTDANNGETHYSYDALNRLTSVTDAKGLTTTYRYNAFGDLIEQVSPDTGTTTYSYDKAGNRTSQTDARGITVTYSYDALNRLRFADYPEAPEDVSYDYDGDNYTTPTPNGIGRLTGITDNSGDTSFVYDARGNLQTDIRRINGQIFTTSYEYDAADRLIAMTYPSGRNVTFTRDAVGRIAAIDSDEGNIATDIDYLPFGSVTQLTLGNGIQVQRDYDLDYRLTALRDGNRRDQQYKYDLRNQITQIEDLISPVKSQSFAYEAVGRLINAQGAYGQITYSYDAVGNRLSKTQNAQTESYQYGTASHQLLQAGSTSFSYDAAGNTLSRGNLQFTYNQAGRLQKLAGAATANYQYNALGQRVVKITPDYIGNNEATRFHYNQRGQLIAETDNQRIPIREYIYLGGLPIAVLATPKGTIDDTLNQDPILGGLLGALKPLLPPSDISPEPALYYLHPDHLGTPKMATAANRSIVWKTDTKPFGEASVTTDSIDNPLRFPGQYADAESGLNYNYFRDYDPETGRYIQSDPIGLAGGNNTYAYVGANPILYVDPLGLDWLRPEGHTYVVGRPNTPVEPGPGALGGYLDDYVPGWHTTGYFHDQLVDWAVNDLDLPDWLVNIPTIPIVYIYAVRHETGITVQRLLGENPSHTTQQCEESQK